MNWLILTSERINLAHVVAVRPLPEDDGSPRFRVHFSGDYFPNEGAGGVEFVPFRDFGGEDARRIGALMAAFGDE